MLFKPQVALPQEPWIEHLQAFYHYPYAAKFHQRGSFCHLYGEPYFEGYWYC